MIPTAESIFSALAGELKADMEYQYFKETEQEFFEQSLDKIRTYAKLHVEAALKAAIKNRPTVFDCNGYTGRIQVQLDESILSAYPLTNIK